MFKLYIFIKFITKYYKKINIIKINITNNKCNDKIGKRITVRNLIFLEFYKK